MNYDVSDELVTLQRVTSVLNVFFKAEHPMAGHGEGRLMWGFPKIRGTFLGFPIIRMLVFWGLYWGTLILGNYHVGCQWYAHVCVPIMIRPETPKSDILTPPGAMVMAIIVRALIAEEIRYVQQQWQHQWQCMLSKLKSVMVVSIVCTTVLVVIVICLIIMLSNHSRLIPMVLLHSTVRSDHAGQGAQALHGPIGGGARKWACGSTSESRTGHWLDVNQ